MTAKVTGSKRITWNWLPMSKDCRFHTAHLWRVLNQTNPQQIEMNENANRSLNPDIIALLNKTHKHVSLHLYICSVFLVEHPHLHSSPQMTCKPYWSPFASVWLCVFPFKIFKMFLPLAFTAEVCPEHMSVLQYTAMLCLLLATKHLGDITCCIIHESCRNPLKSFTYAGLHMSIVNLPCINMLLMDSCCRSLTADFGVSHIYPNTTNYIFSEA